MTIRHWLSSPLYFPQPLVNSTRRRRTLSASTKKPAHWLASSMSASTLNSTRNSFSYASLTFLATLLFSLVYSNSK